MQCFEHPRQGLGPTVQPRVGMARLVRAGDVRRYRRLAAQVQARDVRQDLGGRSQGVREVVDEHGAAWGELLDDSLRRKIVATVDDAIDEAAHLYKLDPNLIRAIIRAESAFNPFAVSRAGAQGLMQLIPDTAERFGVTPHQYRRT